MSKDKTLGQVFKEARLKKGLTQVEVAKKAELYWNTLAKIEREEQFPQFQTAQSIAAVLGIPTSVIVLYYSKS